MEGRERCMGCSEEGGEDLRVGGRMKGAGRGWKAEEEGGGLLVVVDDNAASGGPAEGADMRSCRT